MDDDDKSVIVVNNATKAEEVNVPEVVASMQKLAVDKAEDEEISGPCQRRSLRKRKPRNLDLINLNRRCSLRPKKRTFSEMHNEDQIKEYYLDKTVKKHTNSLETIFEEREDSSHTTTSMSVKRFKRMIQFSSAPTDSKLKKRREKVKRVFGSKLSSKKKRNVSMQAFLERLNVMQNDMPPINPNDIK